MKQEYRNLIKKKAQSFEQSNFLSDSLKYLKKIENSDCIILKKFILGILKSFSSENDRKIFKDHDLKNKITPSYQYHCLLKFIRSQKNINEIYIAERLDISVKEYLSYENNEKIISTDLFYKICNILEWDYKIFHQSNKVLSSFRK